MDEKYRYIYLEDYPVGLIKILVLSQINFEYIPLEDKQKVKLHCSNEQLNTILRLSKTDNSNLLSQQEILEILKNIKESLSKDMIGRFDII